MSSDDDHLDVAAARPEIAALHAVIDEAFAVPTSVLSRREVGRWLCDLHEVRSRVEALLYEASAAANTAAGAGR